MDHSLHLGDAWLMKNQPRPAPETAFGQVLRSARSDKNISQEELAFNAGLDRTFISLLERGRRQPSLTTLIELARALGISASDLVARVEKII